MPPWDYGLRQAYRDLLKVTLVTFSQCSSFSEGLDGMLWRRRRSKPERQTVLDGNCLTDTGVSNDTHPGSVQMLPLRLFFATWRGAATLNRT